MTAPGRLLRVGLVEWALTIVALVLIVVAAVSKRISGTPITPAILFVSIGLLVGPKVLDGIDARAPARPCERWPRRRLRSCSSPIPRGSTSGSCDATFAPGAPARHRPAADDRAGAIAGALIFDQLTLGEAVILGVILAPTDAASGQAVVTEPRVPGRIRQCLNVESGLNDGICVPLPFAAVAAADVGSQISDGRSAGTLLLEEIGYGVIGGVAAGL